MSRTKGWDAPATVGLGGASGGGTLMGTVEPGLSGWTSPATGGEWPDKGPAIAAWMVTGIEAWRMIQVRHEGTGTPDSNDEADRLTLHPDVRLGEIGQTAQLILGGATEMLRGLAALYFAHPTFPLTRGHLPTFRSLQEHCGRVIWLLEPGTEVGPTSGALADDSQFSRGTAAFHERAARLRMLNEELADDRLAAARKMGDTQAENQAQADGGLSSGARRSARSTSGDRFPGFTGFAELCEQKTQELHLAQPTRTLAPYSRVSETSHGGLLGLLSDSRPGPAGTRPFTSDERDLEFVATRAGYWWQTAIALCCGYLGWGWEDEFRPFDETLAALLL
jgi:hypothetical protein